MQLPHGFLCLAGCWKFAICPGTYAQKRPETDHSKNLAGVPAIGCPCRCQYEAHEQNLTGLRIVWVFVRRNEAAWQVLIEVSVGTCVRADSRRCCAEVKLR